MKTLQTCCLTGHRDLPADTRLLEARLTEAVRGRLAQGVRYFGVGGAVGFDTLAAEVLLNLRDTLYPQIRVIAVEPFDGFTSRWTGKRCCPGTTSGCACCPGEAGKPIWPGTGTW